MISELLLYNKKNSLFKLASKQIPAINGRYFISPDYGHNLNSSNLNTYLKDPKFGQIPITQKYPGIFCVTPRSRIVNIYGQDWELFDFTLYFLQKSKSQNIDPDVNLSINDDSFDWSEMKDSAVAFTSILKATLQGDFTLNGNKMRWKSILNLDFNKIDIKRITKVSNDNLSGVSVTLSCSLYMDICIESSDTISFDVSGFVKGDKGDPGLSAYEIAVENGFEGTEIQWLDSLANGSAAIIKKESPSTTDRVTFTTLNDFIPESVEVFLNGLFQKPIDDYNTTGTRTIILNNMVGNTENLLVNYIKQ